MKRMLVCLALLIALAHPTRAAADDGRTVVGGLGGFSFDARKGATLAISFGAHVTPTVRVEVEVGKLPDVLPASVMRNLRADSLQFFSSLGDAVTTSGHLDATTVLAMVRLTAPGRERVTPFVEGAAGLAHASGRLTFAVTDPITGASGSSSTIPSYAFDRLLGLHAIVAASAGVTIRLDRHLGVDLGYRYSRILADTAISANRVYAQFQLVF